MEFLAPSAAGPSFTPFTPRADPRRGSKSRKSAARSAKNKGFGNPTPRRALGDISNGKGLKKSTRKPLGGLSTNKKKGPGVRRFKLHDGGGAKTGNVIKRKQVTFAAAAKPKTSRTYAADLEEDDESEIDFCSRRDDNMRRYPFEGDSFLEEDSSCSPRAKTPSFRVFQEIEASGSVKAIEHEFLGNDDLSMKEFLRMDQDTLSTDIDMDFTIDDDDDAIVVIA